MPAGIIAPQQVRSQKSFERLVAASTDLIAHGNFEQASINEIVGKADYSVGAFYSRFKSKESLFHVVQQRFFDDAFDWIEGEIAKFTTKAEAKAGGKAEEKDAAPTITDASRFAVDLGFRLYSRSPGVFRAIIMHTRRQRDVLLEKRVQEFNVKCMDASLTILAAGTSGALPKHLTERWFDGLPIVLVYLRERVLFGGPVTTRNAADDGRAAKAAADMLVAYMAGIDDSPDNQTPHNQTRKKK